MAFVSNVPTSPFGSGLPGDEYRNLKERQNRERLEEHFAHSGSSRNAGSSYRTPYQAMPHEDRIRISQVRHATREALGGSFDFTDGYRSRDPYAEASARYDESYGTYTEGPIPQKYLDEYHAWSRADDAKFETDKYTGTAADPWDSPSRIHAPMYVDTAAMRPSTSHSRRSSNSSRYSGQSQASSRPSTSYTRQAGPAAMQRNDSGMDMRSVYVPEQQLKSKFSFDSDCSSKASRSRSWFHRRP